MADLISKKYSIGIDIGGTKIRGVLWDGEKVVADYELGTPTDNIEHFLIMAKAIVDPLSERARTDKVRVTGAGIGLPGKEDRRTGRLYSVPNLPMLEGKTISKMIRDMLGMPAFFENDASAFLRAEVLVGAAKGCDNVFGVTIGTGIGGDWWVNGKIYEGAHNGDGEPGHMIIDLPAGIDLEASYQKLVKNNASLLAAEAYRGDLLAEQAFAEFGRFLGAGLANIVNLIDPQAFVLGGSAMKSSDLFMGEVKKSLKQYCASPVAGRKVKILKSRLGDNAGAIGAALLVNSSSL